MDLLFSKKVFNTGPCNLVYRHIVGTFRCVWIWPLCAKFLAPLTRKLCQYIGFCRFSWTVSAEFTWSMIYKLIGATFVGVQKTPEAKFLCHFSASQWVKMQVFEYFVKKFLLDSHQSCFICYAYYSQMGTISASKAQFLGHFGPQVHVSKNCSVWWLSQNVFTGFTSVLLHMLIASTLRCVENMGPLVPFLGPPWAPNK